MLVHYIRDYTPRLGEVRENGKRFVAIHVNGHPVAAVVALDREPCPIGVAICSTNDNFNKQRAIEIAAGRAATGSCPNIPHQLITLKSGEIVPLEDAINLAIIEMQVRANKYFKDEVNI